MPLLTDDRKYAKATGHTAVVESTSPELTTPPVRRVRRASRPVSQATAPEIRQTPMIAVMSLSRCHKRP